MSRFNDPQTEWRISAIEQHLNRKADQHEISTTNSNVDRLECTLRESRSEIDGLRAQVEALQETVNALMCLLNESRQS